VRIARTSECPSLRGPPPVSGYSAGRTFFLFRIKEEGWDRAAFLPACSTAYRPLRRHRSQRIYRRVYSERLSFASVTNIFLLTLTRYRKTIIIVKYANASLIRVQGSRFRRIRASSVRRFFSAKSTKSPSLVQVRVANLQGWNLFFIFIYPSSSSSFS